MNLETGYAGLKLKSPVILGSAGISEKVENIRKAQQQGAGAVVMKSLFEIEKARKAPSPRFKLIKRGLKKNLPAVALYSYEQASVFDPERYAEEVRKAKKELEIPVIPSINCVTDEGWIKYAGLMQEAGADAIELNISCPHGPQVMGSWRITEQMARIVKLVKSKISIPAIPKLSPQSDDPLAVALSLEKNGADALTMFNRFTGLDIDIGTEQPIMHKSYAGFGGPWAIFNNLRWISAVYPKIKIPISASGGVTCGEDAVKYILAGASTVQVCTAVVLQGYEIIGDILKGVSKFMRDKGYSSPEEFRGKVNSRILNLEQVDRSTRYEWAIDNVKCSKCGLCRRVCIYGAVTVKNKIFQITDKCDGCGLCEQVCPSEAISRKK